MRSTPYSSLACDIREWGEEYFRVRWPPKECSTMYQSIGSCLYPLYRLRSFEVAWRGKVIWRQYKINTYFLNFRAKSRDIIEYLMALVSGVMLYNVTCQSAEFMFVTGKVTHFKLATLALELMNDLMDDWGNYTILGIGGTREGISNRQYICHSSLASSMSSFCYSLP